MSKSLLEVKNDSNKFLPTKDKEKWVEFTSGLSKEDILEYIQDTCFEILETFEGLEETDDAFLGQTIPSFCKSTLEEINHGDLNHESKKELKRILENAIGHQLQLDYFTDLHPELVKTQTK